MPCSSLITSQNCERSGRPRPAESRLAGAGSAPDGRASPPLPSPPPPLPVPGGSPPLPRLARPQCGALPARRRHLSRCPSARKPLPGPGVPLPTLAPIWLPHWPACRCTISLMAAAAAVTDGRVQQLISGCAVCYNRRSSRTYIAAAPASCSLLLGRRNEADKLPRLIGFGSVSQAA